MWVEQRVEKEKKIDLIVGQNERKPVDSVQV